MKTMEYRTKGVCSRSIHIEVDDGGVICGLWFEGGCNGNLQGISKLAVGRRAKDVIDLVSGIRCGSKETSCPDQLSVALRAMLQPD